MGSQVKLINREFSVQEPKAWSWITAFPGERPWLAPLHKVRTALTTRHRHAEPRTRLASPRQYAELFLTWSAPSEKGVCAQGALQGLLGLPHPREGLGTAWGSRGCWFWWA